MDALAAGHDAEVQMIDTSVMRVHQHGACIADNNHQTDVAAGMAQGPCDGVHLLRRATHQWSDVNHGNGVHGASRWTVVNPSRSNIRAPDSDR
jgi:hypothetical protein